MDHRSSSTSARRGARIALPGLALALCSLAATVGTASAGTAPGGAASGSAATAGQVRVDEQRGTLSVVVRYAPASLATEAGVRRLYRRIVMAAAEVCPDAPGDLTHIDVHVRACRARAIDQAVRSIGNLQLAQLQRTHASG